MRLGVMALEVLDASAVHRFGHAALAALESHRAEIDRLNVFPIPDGDTGTNLTLTMRAGVAALDADRAGDAVSALAALARGAVLGAHGNSGVIVSQVLRALADAAAERPACDASMLREGLRRGAEQARCAVADPVEGTVLTVAAAAAAAALAAADGAADLPGIAAAAVQAAEAALRATPDQLPVLATAGVVDAGGQGLVLLLDALARTVGAALGSPDGDRVVPPADGAPAEAHRSQTFGYEVQYLLDASAEAAAQVRNRLAELGDSVVVVGTGDGTWNVHAHVDDVGAALEAGVTAGRPHRISVVSFSTAEDGSDASPVAVVAVVPGAGGAGLARLFHAEGIGVVGNARPSVADVLAAVTATGARRVVLLPNSTRVTEVAEDAAEQARTRGTRVAVVPTRSPVQGLAAIAVHDPARRFDDDVVAMAEAAAATRFAEVTTATHEALTAVGICQAGDILGLIDGEVVEIGHGLLAVAFAVVDRMLGVGAELMTVLVGDHTPPGTGEQIAAHIRELSPLTDVSVYPGGPADRPVVIGVE